MSVLAAATLAGGTGGFGDLVQMGGGIQFWAVPWTVPGSASYATGGDTWTPPVGVPASWVLRQIVIPNQSTTYYITWTGSTTTPLIAFYTTPFTTQVANATNLSAVTIVGTAYYSS